MQAAGRYQVLVWQGFRSSPSIACVAKSLEAEKSAFFIASSIQIYKLNMRIMHPRFCTKIHGGAEVTREDDTAILRSTLPCRATERAVPPTQAGLSAMRQNCSPSIFVHVKPTPTQQASSVMSVCYTGGISQGAYSTCAILLRVGAECTCCVV